MYFRMGFFKINHQMCLFFVEYLKKKKILPTSLPTSQIVGEETANQPFLRDLHSKVGIH